MRTWALMVLIAVPATADTYVVDTEIDAMSTGCSDLVIGDCSLRGAIQRANQHPGLDTVAFGFGANSFVLSLTGTNEDLNQTGDLDILDVVGILGNGNVTIDGSLLGDRVFDLRTDSDDLSVFQGLTITGGKAPAGNSFFVGGGMRCLNSGVFLDGVVVASNGPVRDGGGIAAESCNVIMNFTSIHGNTATNGGGGISLSNTSTLDAALSVLFENAANHGGGLSIGLFASAAIDNSTFSGNTATSPGSAIQNSHLLSLDFVTVVAPPGVSALSHLNSGATTTLSNSLLVGGCESLPGSAFLSDGGNLESPANSCDLDPLVDQVNVVDARLSPLGNYGGPTVSHLPRADSPAVDDPLGAITNCPNYDQRFGPSRPLDGNGDDTAACDIGAIEWNPLFVDGFESGDTSRWSAGLEALRALF